MAASLSGLGNDLEASAISLIPAVRDVLRAVTETRGCLLARMSGSGATCLGLVRDRRGGGGRREGGRSSGMVDLGRCVGGLIRCSRFTRSASRPITGQPRMWSWWGVAKW